jgi:1-acyl-sn-glycerol-3-phosphate acyltransferase
MRSPDDPILPLLPTLPNPSAPPGGKDNDRSDPLVAPRRGPGSRWRARLDTAWAAGHFLYFVLSTFTGAVLAIATFPFDRSGDSVIVLARLWSRLLLATARVKVTVHMHGTLQPGQPYVFVANHQSSVDIWTLYVALPVKLRFIAKKQLGQIPLFGWAMAAGRFIFIDRQNSAAARRSIKRAAERIRDGSSVAIFPEGTRSRDGLLGPFKKGGFHLASEAGVPIVPVAIRGALEIMPRGSLLVRRGHVHVDVGEPVPTGTMSSMLERTALIERVRAQIAGMSGQTPRSAAAADTADAAGPSDQ